MSAAPAWLLVAILIIIGLFKAGGWVCALLGVFVWMAGIALGLSDDEADD